MRRPFSSPDLSPAAFATALALLTACGGGGGGGTATPPAPPVSITLTPLTATLAAGGTQQFTATVVNASNPAVTWSVQEGAAGGTISATGLYTAPSSLPNPTNTFHVVAASAADPTKTATATLTVTRPNVDITVTPGTSLMTVGASQAFTAVVNATPSAAVTWSVQEGAAGGSVTSTGVYTAPASIPGTTATFHVVATSSLDSSKSSSAAVTVTSLAPSTHTMVLFAGDVGGSGNVDGTAIAARFDAPQGVAVDAGGTAFVADYNNHTIRKITPGGTVTTFAGSPGQHGAVDGQGAAARFYTPRGLCLDAAGNLYVAEQANRRIRKITPDGTVTTLAGSGQIGSADGQGTAASFSSLYGLAIDGAGNLYATDTGNYTIRKITPSGLVSTLAGSPGQSGHVDGQGGAARFMGPFGIAADAGGTVYVADINDQTIRVVSPTGTVTTLAGSANQNGSADGTGSAARFNGPYGIAVAPDGRVLVTDTANSTIRSVTSGGTVTTLTGAAQSPGITDGPAAVARLSFPALATVDASGNLWFSDNGSTLRKAAPNGTVTTVAGSPTQTGSADGTGSSARFLFPYGVAADAAGNLYVTDRLNQTLRKISPSGTVTTLAGLPKATGSADGLGSAARFNYPSGVVVDASGTLYIADTLGHTIRKVTAGGSVSTFVGSPNQPGSADGTGGAARFNRPAGLALDAAGNLYVADRDNNTIRKVTPAGVVTTLAGTAGSAGTVDGTGSAARFGAPNALVMDGSGNLYVADDSAIRKIAPGGVVTTLAGTGQYGSADGTGSTARFLQPLGIALDPGGDLWVSDTGNHTLRRVTPAGVVTTVAGVAGRQSVQVGDLPGLLVSPQQLCVLPNGNLAVVVPNGVLLVKP
jgi:sugar lactone lactonase YvrE